MKTITSGVKAYNETVEASVPQDAAKHQLSVSVANATTGYFLVNVKVVGSDDFEPIKNGGVPVQIDATAPEALTAIEVSALSFQVVPVGLDGTATYTVTTSSYANC